MLALHERFTLWTGAGVPVPVRVCVTVDGCALLLVTFNVALTVAAVCGLKVIVNGTLCPDAIVTGSDNPPTLNTELLVVAAVTVTLPPLALRLPDAVPLVPTTTLPSPNVPGETLSCGLVDVLPVPDNAIVKVGFDPFDVIVTAPVALPAACGEKATVKVVL